jgi:DNA invertase Pin-like site-specific DNA recombinase
MSARLLRCAVYTRKSTEEGLDQAYNSLEAQRDACIAFIRSQAGEGWSAVKTRYDDGGLSGATMERPALKQLLSDIEARKVDVVVVYKVDRLTRSLADFARIVDIFDAQDVSFVSVTQQFNTTTSMGRLTLNVLLSFAQFEREVTAERIRDKIAASKKKGMWMGGPPPLGYDVKDRKLVINGAEAATVRTVFTLYRRLGTVRRLKAETDRRRIVTKLRRQTNGKETGGKPFTRGNLYQLLRNPLYIGRIPHKGETYPGQHVAIIDSDTWDAVQEQLTQNGAQRARATNIRSPSLLAGLVFDETGDRLCPTHASKKGQRYRYYISKRLMHDGDRYDDGWRLPAATLENAVRASLRQFFEDRTRLIDALKLKDHRASDLALLIRRAARLAAQFITEDVAHQRDVIQRFVRRIDLKFASILIRLDAGGLAAVLDVDPDSIGSEEIIFETPIQLRRRGIEARLVIHQNETINGVPDPRLCRSVANAYRWFRQLKAGEMPSVRSIARAEDLHECDVSRSLRLAFLAPDIVEAIFDGRQPVELTAERLRRLPQIPLDWASQRLLLGFKRP